MLNTLRLARQKYPRQFWLLFWGMLISTIGSSMIWPFLMLYVSKKTGLQDLSPIAGLTAINAVMGVVMAAIAGPVVDRVGRKWAMVISLVLNGLNYVLLSQASQMGEFAVLMAFSGLINPLYRVAADAMMADLIPEKDRIDAYSIMRMSNNLGIALGPTIGGFIAATSYTIAFIFAAAGMTIYGLLVAFMARETLPSGKAQTIASMASAEAPVSHGYGPVFKDKQFTSFVAAFTITQICAAIMWVMLSVYTNKNFGLPENQYGFIPATNAIMIVLLQIFVTQWSKRRAPLLMLALGSLLYALSTGSVALGTNFWGFWLSMVFMTVGEMVLIPTSSTMAANLAPADMRGRYMSIYSLSWGIAYGLGPILAGQLNDRIAPPAMWLGSLAVGLVATVFFLVLARRSQSAPVVSAVAD